MPVPASDARQHGGDDAKVPARAGIWKKTPFSMQALIRCGTIARSIANKLDGGGANALLFSESYIYRPNRFQGPLIESTRALQWQTLLHEDPQGPLATARKQLDSTSKQVCGGSVGKNRIAGNFAGGHFVVYFRSSGRCGTFHIGRGAQCCL